MFLGLQKVRHLFWRPPLRILAHLNTNFYLDPRLSRFSHIASTSHSLNNQFLKATKVLPLVNICRFKSKKKRTSKKQDNSDSESDLDDDDYDDTEFLQSGHGFTDVRIVLKNVRMDLLMQKICGGSRREISDDIMGGKIKINGRRPHKTGLGLNEGDEIEYNIGTTDVYKYELRKMKLKNDDFVFVIRKFDPK